MVIKLFKLKPSGVVTQPKRIGYIMIDAQMFTLTFFNSLNNKEREREREVRKVWCGVGEGRKS
jgi:hypothetical protein